MGYDVMQAWSQKTFDLNDHVQRRGTNWKGEFSFDSVNGKYILHPDYSPPQTPSPSSAHAPPFEVARSRWSPTGSLRGRRSMRASPEAMTPQSPSSPTLPSGGPVGGVANTSNNRVSNTPLTPRDRHSLVDKLYAAACAGDIPHMELLLALGAPINTPSLVEGLYEAFKPPKSGYLSVLAGAAGSHQLPAVKFLLSRGAELNPNMKLSSSSPLHQACRADDLETVDYLLATGADPNALNCYRTSCLMYAVKHGSPSLVARVLECKPDLHVLSFISTAAVHWAVWPGDPNVMSLLLQHGADPNQPMGDGSTPLHCAAMAGVSSIATCLLEFGADPRRENSAGETPAQVAVENGLPKLAEILMEAEWKRRRTAE